MKDKSQSVKQWAWHYLPLALVVPTLFISCSGFSTPEEISARKQLADVAVALEAPDNESPVSPDTPLQELIRHAIRKSPQVRAAYFDWVQGVERITVERTLPDPRITFEADIQDMVMALMPGLMIDLPGPGKLRAQAAVAAGEAQMKYAEFRRAVLASAANFKQAYYAVQALEGTIAVVKRNLELLQDLRDIAQVQHAAGRASLQDVLRADIENEELTVRLQNLEDSRTVAITRYRTALGYRPETKINLSTPRRFENSSAATGQEIYQVALTRNPTLALLEAEIRKAEAAVVLARRSAVPDFGFGLETDIKPSTPVITPMLSASLPIWRDKVAAEIAAAVAARNAAEARFSQEQLALAVEFASMAFAYRESEREYRLFKEQLIPKAKMSLDVARSGYLGGQSSFIDFIEAERALLQFELSTVEAQQVKEEALLNLSLLIAGIVPLPGIEIEVNQEKL